MYKTDCWNCGDHRCAKAGSRVVALLPNCAGKERLAMLALNTNPQGVHDVLEKFNLPFVYHKG